MSNKCFVTNSKRHSDICIASNKNLFNHSLFNNLSKSVLPYDMTKQWVFTGHQEKKIYHITDNKPSKNWIVLFHKCSQLPMITVHIGQVALSAVCDTGASKSLISNSLAKDLWSDDYMKNLQAAPAFQLIDVNSNFLKVQGITNCEFYMGSSK